MKSWMEYLAAGALVLAFVALAATSARRQSATVDEFAHLAAGCYAWRTGDFSLYMKTPPSGRMLLTLPAYLLGPKVPPAPGPREDGWLPWDYGDSFMRANWSVYGRLLFASRAAAIVAGALVCVLAWRWSRGLYGPAGGLVSLAAAAFSPTLIAHSQVVTTDAISALAIGGYVMALLAYVRRPSLWRAGLAGAVLGLAALCKFTAPMFALLAPPAAIAAYYYPRRGQETRPRPGLVAGQFAAMAAAAWLTVCAGYAGRGIGFHRSAAFQSKAMTAARPIAGLIPLPAEFVFGLDHQMVDAEEQEFAESNYLLGKFYSGRKWHYYPVAVAAKEPVPHLLVLAAAAVLALRRRPRKFEEAALLGAAAAFFLVTSLFNTLQIGARYLLAVYPLCFALMGAVGRAAFGTPVGGRLRTGLVQGAVVVAGLWAMTAAVSAWPHYLAYFSPVAGGPKNGYKVLLDSNLDWGQDLPGLKRWMDNNGVNAIDLAYFGHDDPLRHGIHYNTPGRGTRNRYLAISATFLMGRKYPMTYNPEPVPKHDPMWEYLAGSRERKPAAVIGHTIFVYEKE